MTNEGLEKVAVPNPLVANPSSKIGGIINTLNGPYPDQVKEAHGSANHNCIIQAAAQQLSGTASVAA
jgi:hypothetical protein